MVKWNKVKHFKRSEWRTNPDLVAPGLVYLLDDLRSAAGVPIYIHVAYNDGGHSPDSRHYVTPERPLADAVDFHFALGLSFAQEFLLITSYPAVGAIGFYPFWKPRPGWHIDLRKGKRLYWARDNESLYHYGLSSIQAWIESSMRLESLNR